MTLLQQPNPRGVIEGLLEKRNPVYAQADIQFISHDADRDTIAAEIVGVLSQRVADLKAMEDRI